MPRFERIGDEHRRHREKNEGGSATCRRSACRRRLVDQDNCSVKTPDQAAALSALIPAGTVGLLLIFAGVDLAISRRLFDG
jgi:hypothetical protein